jgi:hypothetical protein
VSAIADTDVSELSPKALLKVLMSWDGTNSLKVVTHAGSEGPSSGSAAGGGSSTSGVYACSRREVVRLVKVAEGPLGLGVMMPDDVIGSTKDAFEGLVVWSSMHPVIRAGDVIAAVNGVPLGPLGHMEALKVLRAARHRFLVLLEGAVVVNDIDMGGSSSSSSSTSSSRDLATCTAEKENVSETKGNAKRQRAALDNEGNEEAHQGVEWRAIKRRYLTRYGEAQDARVTASTGHLGSKHLHTLHLSQPMAPSRAYPGSGWHDDCSSDLANISRRYRRRSHVREGGQVGLSELLLATSAPGLPRRNEKLDCGREEEGSTLAAGSGVFDSDSDVVIA